MKTGLVIVLGLGLSLSFNRNVSEQIRPTDSSIPVQTTISGYPGEKIDMCIEKRIIGQDIDHLIEPFKDKTETWCWQSEFWGKWMLSAVSAYVYTQDAVLMKKMEYAVKGLLETQLPNGYIGN